MDYDLHITFMGDSMGTTPVSCTDGKWVLCDACYDLDNAVGSDGHNDFMVRIFEMLADGAVNGAFNGLTYELIEA